jgi:heme-degrading monooxygenase HmoA
VIARRWRGAVRPDDADTYADYLEETGLQELRRTTGNRGAYAFRRIDGERCEYLVLSLWESIDDVKRFAGDEPERAVFYPEDDRFLIDRELTVTHWDVASGP